MTDFYNILGVNKNSTLEEIKNSYRKLAKENHPDKGGNKENFQKIQEAYETLSDPNKKRQYDNPNPIPDFFDINTPFNGGINIPFGFNINLNNFFNKNANKRKRDHNYSCNITLVDVYNGATKIFNLSRIIVCNNCMKKCIKCNGTGKTTQQVQIGITVHILEQPCNNCNNKGKIKDNSIECKLCNNGEIQDNKTINLVIPKGVENNKKYVYEGWGEQPTIDGEIPGDLNIIINIENSTLFERDGLHLKYKTKITLKESLVGKKITIPYFTNSFDIEIKDFGIINPNKEYIILKKGLQNDKNEIGNMYIKFEIIYPEYHILNSKENEELSKLLDILKIE